MRVVCVILAALIAGHAAWAEPIVRGRAIDGRPFEGLWQGVDDQGRIVVKGESQVQTFLPGELADLSLETKHATTQPADAELPWTVYLVDGSRFATRLVSSKEGELTLQTSSSEAIQLSLSDLAAIRFGDSSEPDLVKVFQSSLDDRAKDEDTLVILRDGTLSHLKGITEALTAETLTFQWRGRSRSFPLDRVYGLMIAAGVGSGDAAPVMCRLQSGELLGGQITVGDAKSITLELITGQRVSLPVARLAEIRFRSDRVLYLTDLEPEAYAFEPFSTSQWPWRRDRSVANRPLRIGDQNYTRGIGMHSQSRLTFALPEGFTSFAADIGIDEEVGYRGNVIFRVLVDGEEAYASEAITGDDKPLPVRVAVDGAKTLTLVVEFGERLDIGDQANWADARLVK